MDSIVGGAGALPLAIFFLGVIGLIYVIYQFTSGTVHLLVGCLVMTGYYVMITTLFPNWLVVRVVCVGGCWPPAATATPRPPIATYTAPTGVEQEPPVHQQQQQQQHQPTGQQGASPYKPPSPTYNYQTDQYVPVQPPSLSPKTAVQTTYTLPDFDTGGWIGSVWNFVNGKKNRDEM